MSAESAVSAGSVDTDAIAAAVAAAIAAQLDTLATQSSVDALPSAAEVAAAVDAPTAAEIATAVAAAVPDAADVQTAAAAAITASGLAAAIDAVPTAAENATAVDGALDDEFAAVDADLDALPTAAEVADAVIPDYIETDKDLLTGAAEIIVGTVGQTIKVYGFTINNSSGFQAAWSIMSCDIGGANPTSASGDPRYIAADGFWDASTDTDPPLFTLPVGKSLTVQCPDPWPVRIRYLKS